MRFSATFRSLRSGKISLRADDYKHFVPPGLCFKAREVRLLFGMNGRVQSFDRQRCGVLFS